MLMELLQLEKDQQLKTTFYIYRQLYQNFMGTANPKTTIDTHTKKKKQPNWTLKMVIKSQEKRRKEEGKGRKKFIMRIKL